MVTLDFTWPASRWLVWRLVVDSAATTGWASPKEPGTSAVAGSDWLPRRLGSGGGRFAGRDLADWLDAAVRDSWLVARGLGARVVVFAGMNGVTKWQPKGEREGEKEGRTSKQGLMALITGSY